MPSSISKARSRFDIAIASAPGDIEAVRELFLEYANGLGFKLCFQGFDREMASLPGSYAAPLGRLFLARDGGEPVGCVGLRPHAGGAAEMKRLYVRPRTRGHGLGRQLAEHAIAAAGALGYHRIVLETLEQMGEARVLYARLGFRPIAADHDALVNGILEAVLELSPRR